MLDCGASYTYVNDLPSVLERLVRASHERRPIATKTIGAPSATLMQTQVRTLRQQPLFYALIYRKQPEPPPRLGDAVNAFDAMLAHRAAWDAVRR